MAQPAAMQQLPAQNSVQQPLAAAPQPLPAAPAASFLPATAAAAAAATPLPAPGFPVANCLLQFETYMGALERVLTELKVEPSAMSRHAEINRIVIATEPCFEVLLQANRLDAVPVGQAFSLPGMPVAAHTIRRGSTAGGRPELDGEVSHLQRQAVADKVDFAEQQQEERQGRLQMTALEEQQIQVAQAKCKALIAKAYRAILERLYCEAEQEEYADALPWKQEGHGHQAVLAAAMGKLQWWLRGCVGLAAISFGIGWAAMPLRTAHQIQCWRRMVMGMSLLYRSTTASVKAVDAALRSELSWSYTNTYLPWVPFFSNLVMIIFLSFLSFGMLEVVDCYDVGLHWEMVLLSWRIGVDCNYAAMEGNSALRAFVKKHSCRYLRRHPRAVALLQYIIVAPLYIFSFGVIVAIILRHHAGHLTTKSDNITTLRENAVQFLKVLLDVGNILG